jgi:hypothetical protein
VYVFRWNNYIFKSFALEHNHELSPMKSRYFRCNKNSDPPIKRRLEVNDQAGINVSINFRFIIVEVNRYDNLSFGEKYCRNDINNVRGLQFGTGDAEAIQITNTYNLSVLFIVATAYES